MPVRRGVEIDKAAALAHCQAAIDAHAPLEGVRFLNRLLGVDIAFPPEDAPFSQKEACRITFEVRDIFLNMNGVLHGGVIATVLDMSMGHLVHEVAGPDVASGGATMEMKVQYLRAITEGVVTTEGRFLRRGRNVGFLESKMWDAEGRLAAAATGTFKMPTPREAAS